MYLYRSHFGSRTALVMMFTLLRCVCCWRSSSVVEPSEDDTGTVVVGQIHEFHDGLYHVEAHVVGRPISSIGQIDGIARNDSQVNDVESPRFVDARDQACHSSTIYDYTSDDICRKRMVCCVCGIAFLVIIVLGCLHMLIGGL